jgi:hypothetical protein
MLEVNSRESRSGELCRTFIILTVVRGIGPARTSYTYPKSRHSAKGSDEYDEHCTSGAFQSRTPISLLAILP